MVDAALRAPPHGGEPAPEAPTPMESDFSPRKIKIATVVLLGQTFATSILPFLALGYVLPSMTQEFGWSRTQFLFANSFLMWFGALTVWPMGGLTDRIGARPIILIGTLGVAIADLLLPFIHNAANSSLPQAWQLYVLFALLGIFGSSGASYSKVTTALFTQNRGKAMAIFGVEGTLARMFIPGVSVFLIAQYGWRGLFTSYGLITLAILPLIFFFLEEPGTRGLKPTLGFRRPAGSADGRALVLPFDGKSFGQILGDGVFWAMLVANLVGMFVGNGMMANIPTSLTERGFDLQAIGWIDTAATLAGIPGILLAGYLMDKAPTARIAVPFHLITGLSAYLTMIVTPTFGGTSLLLAARLLFMFAFTTSIPMTYYFLTRFFGLKAYAQSYGFMSAVQAICLGFAAPLYGYIRDATGSYDLGYQSWIAASLLAAVVFGLLPRYRFSAEIGAMPAAPKAGAR